MFGSLADKIESKYIPVSGSFELTWRCNLNCRFCYQYQNSNNELTLNEIKKILDQLASLGCLFLSFTGGEPLLRPDFWDIAEYAQAKHFALTLQTNGTLITEDVATRIKELNFFDLHISLLGSKAETHDWFTQSPGSFDKIIKAIEFLRKQNIKVVIKTTVMKQSFSELKGIDKIAREFGCQQAMTPVVSAKSNGDKNSCNFRVDDCQMKDFYSYIFKKNLKQKEDYESLAGEAMVICRAGRSAFSINPIGEVCPCVGLPVSAGSLREESFGRIWNRPGFIKILRESNLDTLPACSKCNLLSICMRCMGMAYLEDGSIFAPSKEACRIANIIKEVIKDEKEKV